MRRCRCCRQSWPIEFYTVCRSDGLRRRTCMACRRNCGPARVKRMRETTRAWKARLAADVAAVRQERVA
jgi:hypothetical protein